jgi:hypothetical protein
MILYFLLVLLLTSTYRDIKTCNYMEEYIILQLFVKSKERRIDVLRVAAAHLFEELEVQIFSPLTPCTLDL